MISDRDLVTVQRAGDPYTHGTMERATAERAVDVRLRHRPRDRYELIPVPSCRCCGDPAWANLRCTKHQDRNPCVVEGCTRTMPAHGWLRDDSFLCGEHWRLHCPPGSPIRRAFNRLARLARKLGYRRHDRWPKELQLRRWRLWDGLLRRIRRGEPEGHIDQAAIERMFGWDDEG